MPYFLSDEHFFFSDLRGFVTNYGARGGNFGGGYRFLDPLLEGWYGGSLWYDVDDSSSNCSSRSASAANGDAVARAGTNGDRRSATERHVYQSGRKIQFAGNQLLYRPVVASRVFARRVRSGSRCPLAALRFLGRTDRCELFAGMVLFSRQIADERHGFKADGSRDQ